MWRLVGLLLLLGHPATAVTTPESQQLILTKADSVGLDVCSTTRDVETIHPPKAVVRFWRGEGPSLTLGIRDFRYVAEVHSSAGSKTRLIPVDVEVTMPSDVSGRAYCSDLNGDGVSDFVVTLWLHGNGLGAAIHERLVVLSSQDDYRFWIVRTMWPSPEDLMILGPEGILVMVTTDFARNRQFSDESYYIYDLWRFRDGAIVSANDMDPGFPKWVSASGRPDNQNESLLDEELKQRLRPTRIGPREAVPR